MSDLNQIAIFVKVVDTRSFTAAGRALGLPKSTVSRKVAQLERRLGAQLLHRTTRKLGLTETGAAFYQRCARVCSQIEAAEHAVAKMEVEPEGLLRVAAPERLGPFCTALTGQWLSRFPKVELELELCGRRPDLLEDDYDLLLELGPLAQVDSRLANVELGRARRVLVASPDYFNRRGTPHTIDQLTAHPLLIERGVSLRDAEGLVPTTEPRARLIANDVATLREAAVAGLGIAWISTIDCQRELESGRLVAILVDRIRADLRVHALYPTTAHLIAKVRTFVELARAQLDTRPSRRAAQPNQGVPVSVPLSPVLPPDSDSVPAGAV